MAQEGEIIYTEYEPPIVARYLQAIGHENTPIGLDLDHNGTTDLRFYAQNEWGHWVSAILRNTSAEWQFRLPYLLYQEDEAVPIGDTVGFGNIIADIDNSWASAYRFYYNFHHQDPPFPVYSPEDHYYICVRHQVEEGYCYGWIDANIRIVVGEDYFTQFEIVITVSRMAYCTIPNYPLFIGQTGFGSTIQETEIHPSATVHPNPSNGMVIITGEGLKEAVVFNSIGQKVATAKGVGRQLTVDLTQTTSGIYFVSITDENGKKCVKKVVKQ